MTMLHNVSGQQARMVRRISSHNQTHIHIILPLAGMSRDVPIGTEGSTCGSWLCNCLPSGCAVAAAQWPRRVALYISLLRPMRWSRILRAPCAPRLECHAVQSPDISRHAAANLADQDFWRAGSTCMSLAMSRSTVPQGAPGSGPRTSMVAQVRARAP